MPFGQKDTARLESTRRLFEEIFGASTRLKEKQVLAEREKTLMDARKSIIGRYAETVRASKEPFDKAVFDAASEASQNLAGLGLVRDADLVLKDVATRERLQQGARATSQKNLVHSAVDRPVAGRTDVVERFRRFYDPTSSQLVNEVSEGLVAKETPEGKQVGKSQEELREVKDKYNQADSAVRAIEKAYPEVAQWKEILKKQKPELYAVMADESLTEDEKSEKLRAALLDEKDETLKDKLKQASILVASEAKREGYHESLKDRGYTVDKANNLVRFDRSKRERSTGKKQIPWAK